MEKEPETNPTPKASQTIDVTTFIQRTGNITKFKVTESAVGNQSLHFFKDVHANNKSINASHQQQRIPTVIDIDNVKNYETHQGDENIYEITSSEKQQERFYPHLEGLKVKFR